MFLRNGLFCSAKVCHDKYSFASQLLSTHRFVINLYTVHNYFADKPARQHAFFFPVQIVPVFQCPKQFFIYKRNHASPQLHMHFAARSPSFMHIIA